MNFYDTNILLSNLSYVEQNGKFLISSVTIEELENIKTSALKDEQVKWQARKAVRFLTENKQLWGSVSTNTSVFEEYKDRYKLPNSNDGKIIYDFLKTLKSDKNVFITNDLLCLLFALGAVKEFGADVKETVLMLNDETNDNIYNGYLEMCLSNDEYTEVYDKYQSGENPYNLIENQYLIINCDGKTTEYVYRCGALNVLKLPKEPRGLNAKQRCVLDLLENESIPIKVICGVYGTGKTFLSVNVAVNKLQKSKSNISKIFLVRQPYGEGDDIGFLKGTKEEKIKDFFTPFIDNIEDGMFTVDRLLREGQLECDVPYYMKGRSLPATMVLVDEAEDLTLKQIKLLGSRIAEKSNIVFIGDWHQASGKYEYNCGLTQFIKYIYEHPSPLVGVMVMDEDVRSDASKYFADI